MPPSSSERPGAGAHGATSAIAVVTSRGRSRIEAGHPWVFRQDIVRGPATDIRTGGPALVRVNDERGRPLAHATWAAEAKIALRVLTREGEGTAEGDEREAGGTTPDLMEVVEGRLMAAAARRGGLALDRDAYRLVHGEADGVPGFFADVYGDALVVQTTSVVMDAHRETLARNVAGRLGARIAVARDDGSARDFEGMPRTKGVLFGSGETRVVYRLGPNELEADLLEDGKTGGFLDQADNQARVAALAPRGASALDAFTYHGGFALALARRGGRVLAIDEDATAVERAAANARRNGLLNMEARRANAFDLLRSLEAERARFEVVVLDPPAFGKRQGGATAADRAYKEIMLRGFRLATAGGLVVACSCSAQITRDHFDVLVGEALAGSGRRAQILERRGGSADHPELVGVPETGYLKCWILRVL